MIPGFGIGGIIGYLLGKSQYESWEEFIKKYEERFSHLSYFKVPCPIAFIQGNKTRERISRETINSFLLGLPNASVPLTIKLLEIGLKERYREKTGEVKQYPSLSQLIDWAENYLGKKKELAHGFRIFKECYP